jgi:polyisoprenyl-teichoic acid--peptidoglycan teichoic acid transferase
MRMREANPTRSKRRSRSPRWARICTALGALLLVLSGGALTGFEVLKTRYEGAVGTGDLFGDQASGAKIPKTNIKGPLNVLLVGIDPRQDSAPPLADSIMILNIPAGLKKAYLFSMPRDLVVDIPRFEKANFQGGRDKLNAAMSYGSQVGGKLPDAVRGFELLQATIADYTGIKRFDAGAIVNFAGFVKTVDAMGGVDMYIEREVRSEHRAPDGSPRPLKPGGGGYLGPQAVYTKGNHHLKGWQALDYVRQRYPKNGVPDSDYGRQRHQQQFLKAMVNRAFSKDVVSNPLKLDGVLRAAGNSLIFNGRGHSIAEFGFALRGIRSSEIVTVKLPHSPVFEGKAYKGEKLGALAQDFYAAVRANTVEAFLTAHPALISR